MKTPRFILIVAATCMSQACGSEASVAVSQPQQVQGLFGPDEAEFQVLVGVAAASPAGDEAACADARAAVDKEVRRLKADRNYPRVTGTQAFKDTVGAYRAFKASGCPSPGAADEPLSSRCQQVVRSVDTNWNVVKSTPDYQALMASEALGGLSAAWGGASSAGCYKFSSTP